MVKITNGVNVFEVTRGAYEGIYSKQGYTLLNEGKSSNVPQNPQEPVMNEDDKFLEEILEKPVSQWSKAEVKQFAALKGIDLSGTKNVGEAKELIKNFVEQDMD